VRIHDADAFFPGRSARIVSHDANKRLGDAYNLIVLDTAMQMAFRTPGLVSPCELTTEEAAAWMLFDLSR
jgi:hypothetical protein